MKKINFKLFLTLTTVLFGVFSLFFISNTKVSAQTNQLPTISFTNPSNGATFDVGDSITLNISASDPDGTVDLVTLFQGNEGGTLIKTFEVPPYTYVISQNTLGDYTYSAQAFDNTGGVSATSITIKIIKPSSPPPSPPLPPTPTPSPTSDNGSTGLVPCDGSDTNPCGFYQFLDLINKVVNYIIVGLVIPISAIMFAYAGFELLTSGGETSKREKAKKIFTDVAIGLIVVMAAFLIVQTVLGIVGYDKSWDWFGF